MTKTKRMNLLKVKLTNKINFKVTNTSDRRLGSGD